MRAAVRQRGRVGLLVLTAMQAVVVGGCGGGPPRTAACHLVRATDVAEITGSAATAISAVTSDAGPSAMRGCAFTSGGIGYELWYLRDGGQAEFDSMTARRIAGPTLTRTSLGTGDLSAIELAGPSTETVFLLRDDHFAELTVGPLSVPHSSQIVVRRLAVAMLEAV